MKCTFRFCLTTTAMLLATMLLGCPRQTPPKVFQNSGSATTRADRPTIGQPQQAQHPKPKPPATAPTTRPAETAAVRVEQMRQLTELVERAEKLVQETSRHSKEAAQHAQEARKHLNSARDAFESGDFVTVPKAAGQVLHSSNCAGESAAAASASMKECSSVTSKAQTSAKASGLAATTAGSLLAGRAEIARNDSAAEAANAAATVAQAAIDARQASALRNRSVQTQSAVSRASQASAEAHEACRSLRKVDDAVVESRRGLEKAKEAIRSGDKEVIKKAAQSAQGAEDNLRIAAGKIEKAKEECAGAKAASQNTALASGVPRSLQQALESSLKSVEQAAGQLEKSKKSLADLNERLRQAAILEAGAGTEKTDVKPLVIPDLPPKPIITPPSSPRDVHAAQSQPASAPKIIGRWQQVSDVRTADFLPGGYVSSTITVFADGTMEVQRQFDADGTVVHKWRIGYEWDKTRNEITFGGDPALRPAPESLKGYRIESRKIEMTKPVQALPAKLHIQLDGETMEFGGKKYRSLPETPASD